MTAQRYLQYLPDFVAEYVEFQKLGEIEGEVLEEESKAKQEMEQDQWILTATRKGLLRRAAMMGLSVAETEDTEICGKGCFPTGTAEDHIHFS